MKPEWRIFFPFESTTSSSTHTSNASTVPPGKKWPTRRVRTTTSSRAVSPRRSAASTLSSGATTSAASRTKPGAAPKLIDSSPAANVVLRRGSPPPTARPSRPSGSPGTRPNTSIVTAPDCRKAWVTCSCSSSRLTKGSAVLAPGKRCEWTLPSRAAGSFAGTSGMWQSAQPWGFAG